MRNTIDDIFYKTLQVLEYLALALAFAFSLYALKLTFSPKPTQVPAAQMQVEWLEQQRLAKTHPYKSE